MLWSSSITYWLTGIKRQTNAVVVWRLFVCLHTSDKKQNTLRKPRQLRVRCGSSGCLGPPGHLVFACAQAQGCSSWCCCVNKCRLDTRTHSCSYIELTSQSSMISPIINTSINSRERFNLLYIVRKSPYLELLSPAASTPRRPGKVPTSQSTRCIHTRVSMYARLIDYGFVGLKEKEPCCSSYVVHTYVESAG